jgi:hypothetical protein
MLVVQGKEVFAGMSRKAIDDRGGNSILCHARESLQPATHKKAYGFSIEARMAADPTKHKGF